MLIPKLALLAATALFAFSASAQGTRDSNTIIFADLPFASAIKQVKGNGTRVIAVFEDPNCGYCKRLHQTTLKEIDNVTIYTFLYNYLSDDSFAKSQNIWCAPDRAGAWDDWMSNGKAAAVAPANCRAPNDKVYALSHKLKIIGTPALFFADGTRIESAIDTRTLEAKFATVRQ